MSSFQVIGIEEFHCIQRCPHFRGWNRGIPLYTEVSSFQVIEITVYRGVLISGGWNRGISLYTEVSSFQGVGIEEFHCIQRCPHFRVLEYRSSTVYRGVLISECWNRGVPLYTEVSSVSGRNHALTLL